MNDKKPLFSVTKKDLIIDFFSGTGKGGQYRNRHKNCVRLHHPDSGALVTGQSFRERTANLKEALNNLAKSAKFLVWQSKRLMEILEGETIEEKVDRQMRPENLKIEYGIKDD